MEKDKEPYCVIVAGPQLHHELKVAMHEMAKGVIVVDDISKADLMVAGRGFGKSIPIHAPELFSGAKPVIKNPDKFQKKHEKKLYKHKRKKR